MISVKYQNLGSLQEIYDVMRAEYKDAHGDPIWYVDVLKEYTKDADSVCEFGVWNGFSSIVFALNGVKDITSCDIDFSRCNIDLIKSLAKEQGIDIKFVEENSTGGKNHFEADFIFFDTMHTYDHVKKELEHRADDAKKFFAVHDTNYPPPRKNPTKLVRDAVLEFIDSSDNWELELEKTDSTGIMVAKRVKHD